MSIDETDIRPTGSRSYDTERVDRLPFGTPEKAERYQTERFLGATGLNWYTSDPTLQFQMRYLLTADELEWATPRLERLGGLMGGPISERADLTDKNPPRLIKYDRWGHDISEVLIPESALATKRDLAEHGFGTPAFRDRGRARRRALRGADRHVHLSALPGGDRHDLRDGRRRRDGPRDGGSLRAAGREGSRAAQDRLRRMVRQDGQFFTERTGGSDLGELETTATPNGDSWLLERVQVVLVELRRRGVRRPRQAGGRSRRRPRHRPVPRDEAPHGRYPQRDADPPAEGQARNQGRAERRGRVRRRRGVPAGAEWRRATAPATDTGSRV